MVAGTLSCALCGLKIVGPPVTREIDGVEKQFCCEGCARVYQLAHENDMLDEVLSKPPVSRPGFTDLVLTRGQENAYFSLNGMWCAGCAVAAEKLLRNQPGVKSVDVSFAAERGRIQYDPAQVDLDDVLQRLDSLGYHARSLTNLDERQAERHQENMLLRLIVAAAFGMQVMLLYLEWLYPLYAKGSYDATETRRLQYVVWAMATPVLFIGAPWQRQPSRLPKSATWYIRGLISPEPLKSLISASLLPSSNPCSPNSFC